MVFPWFLWGKPLWPGSPWRMPTSARPNAPGRGSRWAAERMDPGLLYLLGDKGQWLDGALPRVCQTMKNGGFTMKHGGLTMKNGGLIMKIWWLNHKISCGFLGANPKKNKCEATIFCRPNLMVWLLIPGGCGESSPKDRYTVYPMNIQCIVRLWEFVRLKAPRIDVEF